MRGLIWVVTIMAAAFGGYWWFSAREITSRVDLAVQEARFLSGTLAPVTGFPLRFDVTLAQPVWHDTARDILWRSPWLEMTTPSYKPNQISLRFAPDHSLSIGDQDSVLQAPNARLDLVIAPTLIISQINGAAPQLNWQANGQTHRLRDLQILVRHQDAARHALTLDLPELVLDPAVLAGLGLQGPLSPRITDLHISADLGFDRAISLTDAPRLQTLDIGHAALDWGGLKMTATGELALTAQGTLDGTLNLSVADPQILLDALIAAEILTPDMAGMAMMVASAMTNPETGLTELPLMLRNSAVTLGPFVLGRVPTF